MGERLVGRVKLCISGNQLTLKPDWLAGEGLRSCELTLHDLKTKFKRHTVSATLQCTGNRRHEINEVRPVQGLDWDVGAIGNASWTGVRLSDILKVCR